MAYYKTEVAVTTDGWITMDNDEITSLQNDQTKVALEDLPSWLLSR